MPSDESVLSVVALGTAGAALVVAGIASVQAARARRLVATLQGRRRPSGAVDVDADALGFLRADLERLEAEIGYTVQRVGVVRFDAFEDMGGQLSFATALLDAHGRGVVLSSIHGRREARIYAKPVESGTSRYNLTDEEKEAIKRALAPGGKE
jgi:hypothetical protein